MTVGDPLRFAPGGLDRDDVVALLAEHLAEMRATSPAESVHALPLEALSAPEVAFWTVREGDRLLGCGALKDLGHQHAEIKSMRTSGTARGRGIGQAMVRHLLGEARRRGFARVSLETGTQDHFAPARRLYERHGFVEVGPFGEYRLDPSSIFYALEL
ncbi:GNAT family N-acetyltransferase [Aeromicrobium sp. Leaf350]|uniref:GNAT family N-acetyltransferase n=1 Tax=Aeromicrobium sp. Leaf350 TaxID=2876565 RepID=UPI001E5B002F|nr:GNAT family N-acetyltransferase [Aeromicrobium sp. Leaf350]